MIAPDILFVDIVDRADVWMIECRGACASRSNRANDWGSRASSAGRNFKATKRSSRVSWALYTTPIPPPPNFSMMR